MSPRRARRKLWCGAESKAVAELPGGLSEETHVQMRGRQAHPWYRRVLFGLVSLIPILALLNVFGQHPSESSASGADGTLTMSAPEHLRGGLMFQARFDMTANRDLDHPQLVLSPGWFEELTENSTSPEPLAESSSNGRVTLSYGPLKAGQKLTVWLQYQVNPVNVGKRTANVQFNDGPRPIAQIHRDLVFFP